MNYSERFAAFMLITKTEQKSKPPRLAVLIFTT